MNIEDKRISNIFIQNGHEVDAVLNGTKNETTLYFWRPNDFENYIESNSQYLVSSKEFDSNGWQHDYWYYMVINSKKYILSGDSFYNNHCNLKLEE